MAGGEGIGHRPGACQDGAVAAADAHGADLDDDVSVPQDGIGDLLDRKAGAQVFFAGVKEEGGQLLTSGGRVLGVTQTAPTLGEAVARAYESVKNVTFANAYYRKDIGKRALAAEGTVLYGL